MAQNEQLKIGLPEDLVEIIKRDAQEKGLKPPQIIRPLVMDHYRERGLWSGSAQSGA
jgi:hypothetical protein